MAKEGKPMINRADLTRIVENSQDTGVDVTIKRLEGELIQQARFRKTERPFKFWSERLEKAKINTVGLSPEKLMQLVRKSQQDEKSEPYVLYVSRREGKNGRLSLIENALKAGGWKFRVVNHDDWMDGCEDIEGWWDILVYP